MALIVFCPMHPEYDGEPPGQKGPLPCKGCEGVRSVGVYVQAFQGDTLALPGEIESEAGGATNASLTLDMETFECVSRPAARKRVEHAAQGFEWPADHGGES